MKSAHLALSLVRTEASHQPGSWRIAASRKVTPLATQRNRWKRIIREILRRHQNAIGPGYQATLIVHSRSKVPKASELEREILELIDKIRVTNKDE